MLGNRMPVFFYEVVTVLDQDVLCIEDEYDENQPTMTVTNGVEEVLESIKSELGSIPSWVIYKDTEGHWDRIHVNENGEHNGFSVIVQGQRPPEREKALKLVAQAISGSKIH